MSWCRPGMLVAALLVVCAWTHAPRVRAAEVIALHPLEVPEALPDRGGARARLESGMVARLEAAGHRVVASAASDSAWRTRVREVSGFYDPFTGDTVQARYDAVHRGTLRELAARFGATRWLRASLEIETVVWDRGKAEWAGASEGVAPLGEGRVPALTLAVAVEDTSGAIVARGRGGIQVLAKVKGERFQNVPPEKLLTDQKRIDKAIGLALADLLGKAGR